MAFNEPIVHTVHETNTGTWQYIVADATSKQAAIIDPVLDFDPAKNEVSTQSADTLLSEVFSNNYVVEYILETHLHADHLSAASYLRGELRKRQGSAPKVCIGGGIATMQKLFADRYGVPEDEWLNAFDATYADEETFPIGSLRAQVLHLPGHTPDHIGYKIGQNVFTGDSIFNPDLGSARCDFPQGSARDLWNSMQRLLQLPSDFKLYTGHDYPPAERNNGDGKGQPQAYATVAEHRKMNKHVKDGTAEQDFIDWRTNRDSGLKEPRLINQALQFNIRAGRVPKPFASGDRMLHVPLKLPESLGVVQ